MLRIKAEGLRLPHHHHITEVAKSIQISKTRASMEITCFFLSSEKGFNHDRVTKKVLLRVDDGNGLKRVGPKLIATLLSMGVTVGSVWCGDCRVGISVLLVQGEFELAVRWKWQRLKQSDGGWKRLPRQDSRTLFRERRWAL